MWIAYDKDNKKDWDNMYSRRVLNFITPNISDKFSWVELNCIYRPTANILKCFAEDYYTFYLLLQSFLDIYCFKKADGKECHYLDDHYHDIFQELLGISANKVYFTNKFEFINNIKKAIDNTCPVLLRVDLMELHYYEMYKVQHHDKNFTIYGYDLDKEIFYILDNLHTKCVDDVVLSQFAITFDELYRMAKSYNEYYSPESKPFFFAFQRENKQICSTSDVLNILHKIMNRDNYSYPEKEAFEQLQSIECTNKNLVLEKMCMRNNFRIVFYKLFNKICNDEKKEIREIIDFQDKIKEGWNSVRDDVIMYANSNGNNSVHRRISRAIPVMIRKEYELRALMGKFIKDNNWRDERKLIRYDIINNLDCNIIQKRDAIRFELSSAHIYDLWNMSNDGPQIYLDQNTESVCFNLRANIRESSCYQAGIIVLDYSGNKYMFGVFERNKLSLCCPSYGEKYEIKRIDFEEDIMEIRLEAVDRGNNEIVFYYGDKKEFAILRPNCSIEKMGLFARSWGRAEGSIFFKNIEITIRSECNEKRL